MKYKILKYLIAFILFVCVSFFLSLKWYFWEPSNIKKGSLVYMLKVPDVAKNFPVWGTDESLEYDVRTDDGLKPSTTIIRYDSPLSQDKLHKILLNKGYSCKTYGRDETQSCGKKQGKGTEYQLQIEKIEKRSHVRVIILGY